MNPKATTAREIINPNTWRRTPIERSPADITLIAEPRNWNELRKGN
jgi:hypothetical protein